MNIISYLTDDNHCINRIVSFNASTSLTVAVHLYKGMTVIPDWPRLGDVVLGEVTGVAADTAGSVYVFHRGSRHWTQRYVVISQPTCNHLLQCALL